MITPTKTITIADPEQEVFEFDQIQCPKCHKKQKAKIFPERKRKNQMIHVCINCREWIDHKNWKSIRK